MTQICRCTSHQLYVCAALLIGLLLSTSGCSRARQDDAGFKAESTLVAVAATGEARRAPDIATLSTGVSTLAKDANSAIRQNSAQMAKVVTAIKAAGIAQKDIQTSGVSLNPDYAYTANRPPRIKGYYAANTVNVTVRDIGRLGEILDVLVATRANQINGPMFDIDNKDAVLDEARAKAMAQAKGRAESYAKRLGLRIRRVVSIDETGRGTPIGMLAHPHAATQASASPVSAPIAPGENVMALSLDVVYELGR